ncbi:MAG: molybdate ABC transporter substrate-binding protein [Gammaproteobacteria bacterium]|nr:molybdate ABC transporter substrate-binding protein [Gammaproteobacteria bacterium]
MTIGCGRCLLVGLMTIFIRPVFADHAYIATATNFRPVINILVQQFEKNTAHTLTVVSASSRKLYTQIVNGAPHHLLFSADVETPQRLVAQELANGLSLQVYAVGQLVLWANGASVDEHTLAARQYNKLAIANPKLAPYGLAATQTLAALSLADDTTRLVMGENVGQAAALVATGNAHVGLIGLSLLRDRERKTGNTMQQAEFWIVPSALHQPIEQAMVLTNQGTQNVAAQDFHRYVSKPSSRDVIRSYGYIVRDG